nr:hypothetical protein GCM10020185_56970 [Pseudomonas brassicacearum subsp. brassicacearum]
MIIEGAAPVELPILTGTVGPDVIDVRGLTATGRFTFDPGFMSTASCESKITYIDGDNGILLHRGYPIEQLAEKNRTTWKPATCCSTASCQPQSKRPSSSAP